MPHISKYKLSNKSKNNCAELLKELISQSSNKQPLLIDLLTNTEQTMLAKRLAIIYLIRKNESSYYITNTLKVSPSTINRMKKDMWSGKYNDILHYWEKGSNRKSIIDLVEQVITLGGWLPKRAYIPKKWLPYDEWIKAKYSKFN